MARENRSPNERQPAEVLITRSTDPRAAQIADRLSDMATRNPAPDGSPSRQPTGTYRIIEAVR
jgi:hypothetical protein